MTFEAKEPDKESSLSGFEFFLHLFFIGYFMVVL